MCWRRVGGELGVHSNRMDGGCWTCRFWKATVPGWTLSGTRSWVRRAETGDVWREMSPETRRHNEAGELDGLSRRTLHHIQWYCDLSGEENYTDVKDFEESSMWQSRVNGTISLQRIQFCIQMWKGKSFQVTSGSLKSVLSPSVPASPFHTRVPAHTLTRLPSYYQAPDLWPSGLFPQLYWSTIHK